MNKPSRKSILRSIQRVLHAYASKRNTIQELRSLMLDEIVKVSGSKYVYSDRIYYDENNKFKYQVLTAISTSVIRDSDPGFLEQFPLDNDTVQSGVYRFTNTDPELKYNYVAHTGKPHFWNKLEERLSYKGTVREHCPFRPQGGYLENYLTMPMSFGGKIIGVFGIANRSDGFDKTLVKSIKPLIDMFTCIEVAFDAQTEALNAKEEQINAAKAVSESKDMFLASTSHEIRTPLNGILGMVEILSDTTLSSQQISYLKIINECSIQLLSLINDILDFSKISCGKLSLKPEKISIQKCVEDVTRTVAPRAKDKNLDITYYIGSSIPSFIEGDERRLKQILLNLLTNAVKFTEKGQIILKVTLDGDSFIRFDVIDTGIGIPEKRQKHIFDVFTQLDAQPEKINEGTGLGLAITKGLVKLMNGRIELQSVEGLGSTFSVFLKLVTFCEEQNDDNNNNEDSICINSSIVNKNILAVDDNENNRRIICHFLLRLKMNPFICSSAQDAMSYLESGLKIDLIILDICMPETSGITLAKKIREQYSSIPIVALSSIGDIVSPHLFDAQLCKPINTEQLQDICFELLNHNLTTSPPLPESNIDNISSNQRAVNSDQQLRIIVAEDNIANQIVIKLMLQKLGYKNVCIVNHGQECVDKIKQGLEMNIPWDIVLMDIKMPVMSGIEAVKVIRNTIDKQQQPHIIMLTASILDSQKQQCSKLNVHDYITKPIIIDDIRNVLKKYTK